MPTTEPVSLLDVSVYLPGAPIGADYYAKNAKQSADIAKSILG